MTDELSNILNSCINDNSLIKWLRLLIFPYCVLRVLEKSLKKTQSLSSAVNNSNNIYLSPHLQREKKM
jgi:hypothetical protein